MIYFEDMDVGARHEFGSKTVSREEIVDFATQYDPQPFHLDDAAAAMTPFGRLAASGWHTGAMTMRIVVDAWSDKGFMGVGSPGLDELRWLKPVYPGDTIRVSSEVVAKRESRSRPNLGSVWSDVLVHNQDDVLVMKYTSIVMMLRRPA
nr:MaoC family dehydratase [Sphingomicrobium nitratireducens]